MSSTEETIITEETESMGFSTSLLTEGVNVDLSTQYSGDAFSFSALISGDGLDLTSITKDRLNGMEVILPQGSKIPIGALAGTIKKTGTKGQDREITFTGNVKDVKLPIPILPDITINEAYFYYYFLSKAPQSGGQPNYSEQAISIGCQIELSGKLFEAASGTGSPAKVTGAYFISNQASIIYLDFAGTINLGKILTAIFGVTFPNLTIDIESAGFFQLVKKNSQPEEEGANPGDPKKPAVKGLSYSQALNQISSLQPEAKTPSGQTGDHMPPSFPLAQMPEDFARQFTQAFSADDVTGISFWAKIAFDQITLFNSIVTIGYPGETNNVTIYGYRTETKAEQGSTFSNSALFASFPPFSLLSIFNFSGNKGRKNILFQYTSDQNQYELSGSLEFAPFKTDEEDFSLLFDGDLTVNNTQLIADLTLSTGSPTTSVEAPFGMKGMNFAELSLQVDHAFAQTEPKQVPASTNLIISGEIDLNAVRNQLVLTGAIVFEENSPRLALVTLTADPVLTIYDFVSKVIDKNWKWADGITKALGFISGSIYYLKCPETKTVSACKDYTFEYTDPKAIREFQQNGGTAPTPVVYKSGYHVKAVLQFFQEYNFEIELAVVADGIVLSGTYVGTTDDPSGKITIYFIELDSPELTISTTGGESIFEVSVAQLKLFGTAFSNVSMKYNGGVFSGSMGIPNPSINVDWQWTQGNFSITDINGLGTQEVEDLKALKSIVDGLNSLKGGSGGCQAIVTSAFNNSVKTSFSLSLTSGKKPKEVGIGQMNVPLTVTTGLTIAGEGVATIPIDFSVDFNIPTSFSGLPKAIWDTATNTNNLDNILGEIARNPETYRAIALVVAKKVGASVAAKILCKTLDEILAKALEAALKAGEIIGELGEIIELYGSLVASIAAAAATVIGNFLDAIWDEIKSWFGSDSKKDEAEAKVNEMINSVQPLLQNLVNQLNDISNKIQIESLSVGIVNGIFEANWAFPENPSLGSNSILKYKMNFLTGAVGDTAGNLAPNLPSDSDFVIMQKANFTQSWESIVEASPDYLMNASIQTTIEGFNFMSAETKAHLNDVCDKLNGIKGDVGSGTKSNITSFVNSTQAFITKMDGYNRDGLTSSVVYASFNNGGNFTLGDSALGINTRI